MEVNIQRASCFLYCSVKLAAQPRRLCEDTDLTLKDYECTITQNRQFLCTFPLHEVFIGASPPFPVFLAPMHPRIYWSRSAETFFYYY